MRIEIDKEEYQDLIETKEEFVKTVKKLENIIIENIKLTDKLQAKEHELIMTKADLCRGCQYRNDYKNLFKTYKVKEQECEKFESRADELKNTLEKIKEIINSQIEYCSSCENGEKDCEERFCEDYIARDISIKIKSVLKEIK